MRRALALVLSILMALGLASSTLADTRLEGLVSASTYQHTYDANLHSIAHQRAVEIASNFSHDLMRSGTLEVIGWNQNVVDAEATIVNGWMNSPAHFAIITDRSLSRIGCGHAYINGIDWFTCVVAGDTNIPAPAPAPAPSPVVSQPSVTTDQPEAEEPVLLPNTAMH